MSEKKEVCPRCGSDLISEIAGAGKRCGACGHQWAVVRDVIGEAARQRKATGFVGWRRPQQSEK